MNQRLLFFLCLLAFLLLCFVCLRSHPESAAPPVAVVPAAVPAPEPAKGGARIEGRMEAGQVTLSGAVPTADLKTSIAGRARTLYGENRVVDNIAVDTKLSARNWGGSVADLVAMLGGRVSNGSFSLAPDSVTLRGQVQGDDVKSAIVRAATQAVSPQVRVINELTVVAKSAEQAGIDEFLRGKIIEFATGSAVIAPKGREILDQAVPLLRKAAGKTVEISGHTDSDGSAELNMKLSNERAVAVKQYLIGRGLPASQLSTVGYGSTRPVATNSTPDGRQQNRRIEFAIQ